MSLTKVSFSMIQGAPVNVLDYGAKGDGLADDTIAIQAAANAVEATGLHGIVYFPTGTYLVSTLDLPNLVSLVGDGISNTVVKMKNGANSAAVIQTKNFATLNAAANYSVLGTGPSGGNYQISISKMTIDGNKANNSSGRALQIYGKAFLLQDLWIVNAHSDGLFTGYNGPEVINVVDDTFESKFFNLSIQQNGGNGWTFIGPHDSSAFSVEIFKNGGWGWQLERAMSADTVNTYLNASGGIYAPVGGHVWGSNIIGSTATGWGALLYNGNQIASGGFGGPIALEVRNADNNITADINGPTGLVLSNQDSGGIFNLVMHGVDTFIDATAAPFFYQSANIRITSNDGPIVEVFKNGVIPKGTIKISTPPSSYAGVFGVNINAGDVISGVGSPENVVTSPVGGLYLRRDGGANTTLYVKESGTGKTGWVAK